MTPIALPLSETFTGLIMKPLPLSDATQVIQLDLREFVRFQANTRVDLIQEQLKALGFVSEYQLIREIQHPVKMPDEYADKGFFVQRTGASACIKVRQYLFTVTPKVDEELADQVSAILEETGKVFVSVLIGHRMNFDRLGI